VTYSLTPEADAELTDAVTFCAANFGVNAAKDFLATFEQKAELLIEFPGLGTPTTKGRRLYPIGRYPFSILYRSKDGHVRISAIAPHSRRPRYWQKRR
jgi:plasmid stabilization system protein ParE